MRPIAYFFVWEVVFVSVTGALDGGAVEEIRGFWIGRRTPSSREDSLYLLPDLRDAC